MTILILSFLLTIVNSYHVVEELKNWVDAEAYCQNTFGTHLATFTTDAEAIQLLNERDATTAGTSVNGRVWIGLNDRDTEGNWVFSDGENCGSVCNGLSYWRTNEPNGGTGESCGLIEWGTTTATLGQLINDAGCGTTAPFLCNTGGTKPLLNTAMDGMTNGQECEGDCDNGQCGAGLLCWQRDGDGPLPPGCEGDAITEWDYCYDPLLDGGCSATSKIYTNSKVVIANKIYACAGTIAQDTGGLYGTGAGSAQALCNMGYHVCDSSNEAQSLGLTLAMCENVAGDPTQAFFTKETRGNDHQCISLGGGFTGTLDENWAYNDIWGCGPQNNNICGVLGFIIGNGDWNNWKISGTYDDGIGVDEAKAYYLTDASSGGVLCCIGDIVATPVDCEFTWSGWTLCSEECGPGIQSRTATVTIQPENGGAACPNPLTETQPCNDGPCPIDCVLTDWYNVGECSTLCGTGTQNQERAIEIHPQHGGAACGATTQTIPCNEHGCCPNGIKTFDWDRMTGTNENAPTYENFVFNVENTLLTLNIYVELPYLGYTSANHQREAKFGTTYVLDFEDFDAHKDAINEPGTCQNRMHNSFTGKTFSDFWVYTDEPQNPNGIGSINTLAYPPSDKWTMYMKDDGCDTIVYERSFTWQELRDCSGYDNTPFTSVVHEDNKYKLSGTFYINVVSPFWYDSDFGYYRVYQLLSQPFVITVSSVVNVLGSTGINLITMWIIAVYKESQEAGQYTPQQDFRLVVMTETAEYLTLTRTTNSPFNFVKTTSNNNNINSGIFTVYDTPEDGCLNNRDYICTQLWRIDAFNPGCSAGENGIGTDFSGNYELGFTPQCKDPVDQHCNDFLNKHTDIRDNLLISADLIWRDDICDPKVFELQFLADMLFYTEGNQFIDGQDIKTIDDTHLFQPGVDTIYVEIDTDFPDDTLEIFNTELTNVWICTFAPNIVPGSFEDVVNGNVQLNEMGCFNSGKDTSLSNIVNDIYPIPTNDIVNFQLYTEAESNIIQFSFLIPEEVTRDTLYIHAQIEVELQEPITQTRRRMLLDVNTANQISHFGQEIGIKNKKNNEKPQLPINEPQLPVNTPIYLSLNSTWVIVIGSLLALILTCNICFMCYMNCWKNKRGKKGYKKVKYIDSEFDSEAQMIDNQ